jgi:hypothetical protein
MLFTRRRNAILIFTIVIGVLVIMNTLFTFTRVLNFRLYETKKPIINKKIFRRTGIIPRAVTASLSNNPVELKPRKQPVHIIDGVIINDELDMLEVRLEELAEVVDYFIIVEAAYTLQNTPKPLYFSQNITRFAKFLPQIVHVVMTDGAPEFKYWENEALYRNSIGNLGIPLLEKELASKHESLSSDDIIMLCDIDEIPSRSIVQFLKEYEGYPSFAVFSMKWTFYSYRWQNSKDFVLATATTFGRLQEYTKGTNETNWMRYNHLETPENEKWTIGKMGHSSGWHCSWCMQPENMVVKLASFAHIELNTDTNKDLNNLKRLRIIGQWFTGDQGKRDSSPINSTDLAPKFVYTAQPRLDYMLE